MKPPLKVLLLVLVALSVGSGLQKVFGLSARAPEWPPPAGLRLPGYQVSLVSQRAGSIGRDVSTGTTQRLRFQSLADEPAVELTTMAVNSLRRDSMQLERLIRDQPDFSLTKPRFLSPPLGQHSPGQNEQLAIARTGGRTRLQTCLLRSGKAGYWQTTLGDEWTRDDLRRFDGEPARKALDYLTRFLALQPSPLSECLVVQLETSEGAKDQALLLTVWSALKPQLLAGTRP